MTLNLLKIYYFYDFFHSYIHPCYCASILRFYASKRLLQSLSSFYLDFGIYLVLRKNCVNEVYISKFPL